MPIQQNFPAIRPTLLLDFVNVKALDPRVTFSRASTATYYDQFGVLRTALANVARFDHDPITGESKGLLIEESRTNLLTYSEQFDNAAWVKTASSITANAITAPDGALTADKLIADTSTGTHLIRQTFNFVSGTAYTFSTYAKARELPSVRLLVTSTAFTENKAAVFNLVTGTLQTSAGTFTHTIANVGNGWYRVSITATATATVSSVVEISLNNGTSSSFTGNGIDGIYIWGAELEAGAFPTSYIKTEASQVTRAADNASMTGTNFSSWYRQDEGTFFVDVPSLPAQPGADMVLTEVFNSSATNARRSLFLSVGSGNVVWRTANAAGTFISVDRVSGATTNPVKLSAAWQDSGTFAGISYNAEAVISRSDVVVPLGIDSLHIGRGRSNNAYRNGNIRKIAFYPRRLSGANLQAITS